MGVLPTKWNFGEVNSWWLLSLKIGGARGDWSRMATAVLLTRGGSSHHGVCWVTKFGIINHKLCISKRREYGLIKDRLRSAVWNLS